MVVVVVVLRKLLLRARRDSPALTEGAKGPRSPTYCTKASRNLPSIAQ